MKLTEGQQAVLDIIRHYDGACRKDFALNDWYHPGARIQELRDMGYRITTHKCRRHQHRKGSNIVQYVLLGYEKPWGVR